MKEKLVSAFASLYLGFIALWIVRGKFKDWRTRTYWEGYGKGVSAGVDLCKDYLDAVPTGTLKGTLNAP